MIRRCDFFSLASLLHCFDGTYDAYWGNFRPAPGSQHTTDRRPMVDDQGTRYLMSGHHSFTLEEVGGYGNVIEVAVP